ncbi:protein WVD2-like protein 4 isoform X2 [Cinnamomum micranthum f. kanehirae]|uniref:Protein WVD2-like protein 4 isoform X2 n=1 Tax=Cinnamomum micranthum f. kanehirae TaxID=337451 RepID=A0A443NZ73_9MAGN|nr:protein WVD2-like protein 4 isoform X2 [Cinnamomum micranthum f. kanehirae]
MGESACLMQNSFSHASGAAHEDIEANPVSELTGSISFGRFMSETLDWGKWSSFSHNKYLEEVEKYSAPGSVAQKKAYFEAHYKRIAAKKAAALLEQANDAGFPDSEENHSAENGILPGSGISEDVSNQFQTVEVRDGSVESNGNATFYKQDDVVLPAAEMNSFVESSKADSVERMDGLEAEKVEAVDPVMEAKVLTVSPEQIESSQQLGDVENQNRMTEIEHDRVRQTEKSPLMDNSAATKKKSISASKSAVPSRSNKLPLPKPATPVRSSKENNATPNSKKPTRELEKKRSTPKALHMSINFAPHQAGEFTPKIIKRASPTHEKSGGSRFASSSSRKSQNSLNPLKTPTPESTNRALKLPPITPQLENRRTKIPLEHTTPGSRKVDLKWQSLSMDRSKASSVSGTNARSPIVSSPFSFRSDERAAKRKEACSVPEIHFICCLPFWLDVLLTPYFAVGSLLFQYFSKLEEKFNTNETQKGQLQAHSKDRAEFELKKLRQSLSFKAKPMPDFYRETEPPKNLKKIPLTRPRSPRLGRRPSTSRAKDAGSLPPLRPSVKNDTSKNLTEEKKRTPKSFFTSSQTKNTHENSSPNIQH